MADKPSAFQQTLPLSRLLKTHLRRYKTSSRERSLLLLSSMSVAASLESHSWSWLPRSMRQGLMPMGMIFPFRTGGMLEHHRYLCEAMPMIFALQKRLLQLRPSNLTPSPRVCQHLTSSSLPHHNRCYSLSSGQCNHVCFCQWKIRSSGNWTKSRTRVWAERNSCQPCFDWWSGEFLKFLKHHFLLRTYRESLDSWNKSWLHEQFSLPTLPH